ncbi:unnamed protein product [Clavelina lepadiformis]|uniref:procollagen-proline 4-dioxygenase n=1 Tax=Clavelina lepadiformis TaxID=159417 RepID=A0ABP0EUI7_CLALP
MVIIEKGIIVLVLGLTFPNLVSCDWFSSISHMEDLIEEETDLVASLSHYIDKQEAKIRHLKRFVKQFDDITMQNAVDYLSHPVNQFRLFKRLAFEWDVIQDTVKENTSTEFVEKLSTKRVNFPDEKDVVGSAQALMRLQDTYKLEIHQLARGNVNGVQAIQMLRPRDWYDVGRIAFEMKDYYHCASWMVALSLMNETLFQSFTKFDVLNHASFCSVQLGDIETAYNASLEMTLIEPSHERNNKNFQYYSEMMKKSDVNLGISSSHQPLSALNPDDLRHYEALCRDEGTNLPAHIGSKLKCYLWTNHNNPRLILQPAKVEELWLSPQLIRFHDVLSDTQMESVKQLARPMLYRSTVNNPDTGKLEHAKYRVAKSAWLEDSDADVIGQVSRRIVDLTGLSLDSAEMLQVANYGVGGQYEPHYDFFGKHVAIDENSGNRIATFLIYLSDVTNGGSTVFLEPKVGVRPIRGSAAFWYNLDPAGVPDRRTRHAACPVLTGVKWVANKWIHEVGQEFKGRPCQLSRYSDNLVFA